MPQDYVLITRKGRSPVVKKPSGIGNSHVISLLDECLLRDDAGEEIRTVVCLGDWSGFCTYGEQEFRTRFQQQ